MIPPTNRFVSPPVMALISSSQKTNKLFSLQVLWKIPIPAASMSVAKIKVKMTIVAVLS